MAKTTFISWNVNGIRAVEKKEALKWIDENEVDFLGLQEIKAEAEQIPESIFERNYNIQNIIVMLIYLVLCHHHQQKQE